MHRFSTILCMPALAVLVACGGSGGTDMGTNATDTTGQSGGTNGSPNAVLVGNNFFNPSSTTVAAGSTVTWTWNSSGVAHDVVFNDGTVESGVKGSGTFSHTFSVAGTYPYHCSIHGTPMSGTIIVK